MRRFLQDDRLMINEHGFVKGLVCVNLSRTTHFNYCNDTLNVICVLSPIVTCIFPPYCATRSKSALSTVIFPYGSDCALAHPSLEIHQTTDQYDPVPWRAFAWARNSRTLFAVALAPIGRLRRTSNRMLADCRPDFCQTGWMPCCRTEG
jgi:hypothetical protein